MILKYGRPPHSARRCSTTGATPRRFPGRAHANGDVFNSIPRRRGGHRSPFRGWYRGDLRLRQEAISMIEALWDGNEFDINRLLGRLKEADSFLSRSFEPTAPGGSKLAPAQPKSPLS